MKSKKNGSKEYFDNMAYEYDNMRIPEPIRCYPLTLPYISDNYKKLADIGCGTGTMLSIIHEKFPQITKLTGVDLSEQMVAVANEKMIENTEFLVGNVENLPLDSSEYDAVLCMHSFHHYTNPTKALLEMQRIAKKSGKVIIVENLHEGFNHFVYNTLYFLIFRRLRGDFRCYARKELADMMTANGFINVTVEILTKKSYICIGEKA